MTPAVAAPGAPRAPEDALIVAGCSRRKHTTTSPIPALDLYAGGIAPQLRARFGALPRYRARIRFLSAEHGLVDADTPLLPYERRMTFGRRVELQERLVERLREEWALVAPEVVLMVAEPAYLPLLCAVPPGTRVQWIPDPHGWSQVQAVLATWRWP